MKTSTALHYYSDSPVLLGYALGITSQAVSQWGENVPELRALQLEKITNGRLKAYENFIFDARPKTKWGVLTIPK